VRYWFDKVPPLDFFSVEVVGLLFHDLGAERGYYPADETRYRYRLAAVDPDRKTADGWTEWVEISTTTVPPFGTDGGNLAGVPRASGDHVFLAAEVQVDRGDGWSPSTTCYASFNSGRVVALDR